jgi:lysozyme
MEYSKEFRQRLTKEITSDEGCVLKVYEDHLGYKTVGIGHLVRANDPEWDMSVGEPITQTRCDELFFYDINITLKECEENFHNNWRDWPEEVKLIIANMAFNLGLPRLKKFKRMFAALNKQDYKGAAKEGLDSKWAKQVYNRARRLMDRMHAIDVTDKFDNDGKLK